MKERLCIDKPVPCSRTSCEKMELYALVRLALISIPGHAGSRIARQNRWPSSRNCLVQGKVSLVVRAAQVWWPADLEML